MNTHPPSVLELLRKIKALADRGCDGERAAAQAKLDRLLAQYGITLDQIGDNTPRHCRFETGSQQLQKVLVQIVAVVTNQQQVQYRVPCRGHQFASFLLTPRQEADVRQQWSHFAPLVRREWKRTLAEIRSLRKHFVSAFLMANNVYDPEDTRANQEPSPEEMRELLEALNQSSRMAKSPFSKPVPQITL